MRTLCILALLSLSFVLPALAAAPKGPPNIVWIFCDDLAYQAISAYGDSRKLLNTPGMDRIGKEGIRFDRCMVTNSICGPSRACVLTGKYSHANGFYNNSNSRFDSTQTTFPKILQKAGYSTAMIGKWHLMTDPTGFDYWNVLPGQGVYYNPTTIDNGKNVKHTGYVTDIIGDLSLEWLSHRDKTKPFLLMCQHKAPHREWEPPARNLGFDNDRVYDEPPTLFDTYEGRSKAVKDQDMTIEKTMTDRDTKLVTPGQLTEDQKKYWDDYYGPRNAKFRAANLTGKDLVKWRYQRYMHDYLACVKAVDENVTRVLDYLDKEGLADNTVVCLSSDQGFYLGEHGWFDKRWIFEESLRTPLMVRWPGVVKPGTSSDKIVALIDVANTFLDIAGQSPIADAHGKSFVPILKGETPADWRKSLYYHYYEYPVPHHVRPHYGVVTDRYKLIHFYTPDLDEWELLDRQKDPLETKSFYNDPAYAGTVTELKAELTRLQAEVKETIPPPRSAFGNKAFDNEPQPPAKPGEAKAKGKGKGGKKKAA